MTELGADSAVLSLAAEFPAATRQDWRALVAGVLAKSGNADTAVDPEAALASTTYDGFDVAPLYTAADAVPADSIGVPGAAPFVRGARVDGNAARGWDVRQRHLNPDPAELNRAVLADLTNGATSLWLKLGAGGLAVHDLAAALAGVYLDLAPIALDAGADTAAATAALLAVADGTGVARADLRGTLGADPIGSLARTGATGDLALLGELAGLVADSPGLVVAEVDGTVYHDAGGSDSDEIAVATAVGVAYLRALTGSGLSLTEALSRIEFRFAVSADQFSSIAKLRAARRVWARVVELSGGSGPAGAQRQHAVTSAAMLTRRDPWVNLLRCTIACFAAAVGGAEAITVLPFDSAIGVSDDFARRIARNTHAVLHDEASLARVIDPAGGSYYVEALTDALAGAAWRSFTGIERAGGALDALVSGHIPELLAATASRRRSAIATRADAITGVSEFAFIDEPDVPRPPLDEPPTGLLPVIRYAEDFEDLRDRSDAHAVATGHRPRVVLAALGPPAAHSARLSFAANLFQAGGIEPLTLAGSADQLRDLVAELVAAGPVVACLCSSDKVYAEAAAPAAAALKAAGVGLLYLAGKGQDRVESDAAAGVDGYLSVGSDAVDVLRKTLLALEVA
ncbi:methylmalonyl-CoA mutase family protein [soil metagenome]